MKKVLLIHQNFPGQFKHLARELAADPNVNLVAIGRASAPGLPGFSNLVRYQLARERSRHTHPYATDLEAAVLHGQAVARVLLDLDQRGWKPDVVLGHIGWGETLYLKDIWPETRLILLTEFYQHGTGVDCGFDPEFPSTLNDRMRNRARNAHLLLALEDADVGIAATQWQRSLFPAAYQPKIVVNHEGVDVSTLAPDPQATLELPGGLTLRAGQKIVTYVSRSLEPVRGFHIFMRAAEKILQRVPDCQIVVVGGDDISYGPRPKDAAHWREKMLREVRLDPSRIHFLGRVPYPTYQRVLQVSAAHVYLTYPFVLSWSLLEAMASGCLVIGSDTAPVREVIEHGRNGLLVDFFDVEGIAESLQTILAGSSKYTDLRELARATVLGRYPLTSSVQRYRSLLNLSR